MLGIGFGNGGEKWPRQGNDCDFARYLRFRGLVGAVLAESTGKEGKGIIPVDREQLGAPEAYGSDAYLPTCGWLRRPTPEWMQSLPPWKRLGIRWCESFWAIVYDIGQEFFRWEIATAVAGSILGINAFNQPDVEASKVVTKSLTSEYEKTGPSQPKRQFLPTLA